MKNVLWFEELDRTSLAQAGGKGANLGEMSKSGFPIPPGFVVSSGAYFKHLDNSSLRDPLTKILASLDVNNSDALNEASEKIKKLIVDGKIPEDVEREIRENYKKLSERAGKQVYVAVRSSATAEDLPTASFAGQQSTYLNIFGEDDVVKAVKDCWASLFEPRAIFYRVENNFEHMKVGLAAVVQMMVQSEKAGVIFTVDPLYQDPNLISIEVGYGLGEVVVSGQITPDTYRVDKNTLKIVDKIISKQTWAIFKINGKNQNLHIKEDKQNVQKLSDSEICDLAKIAKKIEEHYQSPQDIEYAIEKDNIYIVQARPITTLDQKRIQPSFKTEAKSESTGDGMNVSDAKVLVQGLAASPGYGVGKVKVIKQSKDINQMGRKEILVRETVAKMLNKAADLLPEGYLLIIYDGYRDEKTQRIYFLFFIAVSCSFFGIGWQFFMTID